MKAPYIVRTRDLNDRDRVREFVVMATDRQHAGLYLAKYISDLIIMNADPIEEDAIRELR